MGTETVVPAHADLRFATGMVSTETVNVRGLEQHLRRHVQGEVRFDKGSLAMYANDASNYRQVPVGVVVPKTLDDVVETMRACARYRAPVTCRGGGTSLSGETVNNAVIVDFSKYLTAIGEVDVAGRRVTCETGVINEQLNEYTGTKNLVFGPDPSSHSRCTIGGNIGNNSCGVHSVQSRHYGPGPRTSDNTEALEIVTYDGERFWVGVGEEDRLDEIIAAGDRKGEIYAKLRDLRDRYADDIRRGYPSVEVLPRRVSGYNLDELLPERGFNVARALVGTEGTCAVALRATLLLTPALLERTTVVVSYPDIAEAATHVCEIQDWKPIGLEAVDDQLIHDQQLKHLNEKGLRELPRYGQGGAWLMVQFRAADKGESVGRGHDLARGLARGKGARLRRLAARGEGLRGRPDRRGEEQAGGRRQRGPVGHPRGRPRLHGVPRRRRPLARLGGLRRPAGPGRRLRPRPARAVRQVRHARPDLRPPRRGLHPFPHRLRPAHDRGAAHLPGVSGRGRGHGRLLRRHAVGRARRRSAARRAAREDVRPAADAGHARVQGHLGPGVEAQPRQGGRALPLRREPQAGHRLQPLAAGGEVRLRPGRRRLRARDPALRRRRQVPRPRAGADHVPELPGHPRGEALHAGPGPAAVRDAARRGDHRRLAVDGGRRGARPVPCLQGLHQ